MQHVFGIRALLAVLALVLPLAGSALVAGANGTSRGVSECARPSGNTYPGWGYGDATNDRIHIGPPGIVCREGATANPTATPTGSP